MINMNKNINNNKPKKIIILKHHTQNNKGLKKNLKKLLKTEGKRIRLVNWQISNLLIIIFLIFVTLDKNSTIDQHELYGLFNKTQ